MTKSVARKIFSPMVIVVWFLAIGLGLRFVLAYENSPGTAGGVRKTWPAESAIATLLLQGHAATAKTPVFECELFVTAKDQEELYDASHKE